MKRTLITIMLTTVVVLTLVGVLASLSFGGTAFSSEQRSLNSGYGGGSPEIMMEAPAMAPAPADFYVTDPGVSYDYSYEQTVASVATERMVIQNVDMSIVVVDPVTRMDEIADMATKMGGFMVSSSTQKITYGPNNIEAPQAHITIRIPSEKLDEALASIKEGAVDIDYENRSGEDVTNQYIDLQSRLKAKQAAEKKLLEFLEAATDTEDVLAVYLQLQQIQSEIEVLKGQIQYYEESVALSAVSIRLVADETVQPIEIGRWKLQGTAKQAFANLSAFMEGFTEFLINFFVDYLWRIVAVVLLPFGIFLGGRALYRRFRKAKPAVEVEEKK